MESPTTCVGTALPKAGITFGVGGGFLIVPALVMGLPMHPAVGTSLLAIALNVVWGLTGDLRFGTLDWRLPERMLRVAFAILIV